MNGFPALPLQAAQPQAGGDIPFFMMLIAIGLVWFFLVIRPQQQRQKKHESKLASAEKGDRVITTGGLCGRIVGVGDDEFSVEIATLKGGGSVKVQIAKDRIESVTKPGEEQAEKTWNAKKNEGGKRS